MTDDKLIRHFKGSEWMLRQLLTTGPPDWFRDDVSVTYDRTTNLVTVADRFGSRCFPFVLAEWLRMEHLDWVAEIKELPSFRAVEGEA